MAYDDIAFTRDDDVAWITFDRPETYNALSMDLEEELTEVVHDLSRDSDIRFVVFTGAGEHFSSGNDITEMEEWGDPADVMRRVRLHQQTANTIENMDKITIAAVDGYATGGGLELTLVCDFVIATNRAEWGMPEVNWDITPGWGGTTRLVRYLGRRKTKEVNMLGKLYSAREAADADLWNRIVEPDELEREVADLLDLLRSKTPQTLRQIKIAVDNGTEAPLQQALSYEQLNAGLTAANAWGLGPVEDTTPGEGLEAFREKNDLYRKRRSLVEDFWAE